MAASATLTHSWLWASPLERVESPCLPSVEISWLRRPKQRRPRDLEALFRRPVRIFAIARIVSEVGLTGAVGVHHVYLRIAVAAGYERYGPTPTGRQLGYDRTGSRISERLGEIYDQMKEERAI